MNTFIDKLYTFRVVDLFVVLKKNQECMDECII